MTPYTLCNAEFCIESQNTKFFLGTDSAPHLKKDKESSCGCAGVFNATYCMSVLAQLFEQENSLDRLENFVSINGACHYGLELNKERLTLEKSEAIYVEPSSKSLMNCSSYEG